MSKVPFVPSIEESVNNMVKLADIKPGQKMADLGVGDGRVVIAFAKKGAEAHGYEIDANLVFKTEARVIEESLDDKIFIHPGNYWEEDLSSYDIITIYGMTSIMGDLENKLQKELKPGAKVVSNTFTFPHWKHSSQEGNVFLYVR